MRGVCKRKTGSSGLFLAGLLGVALMGATIASAEPLVLEVTQASAGFDQRNGEPIVNYRLSESSKRLFAEFTSQNVGRKTELRVDGRVVMTPVIREPILGGSGQMSGKLTIEQAKDIAARLSAGTKIEVELVAD